MREALVKNVGPAPGVKKASECRAKPPRPSISSGPLNAAAPKSFGTKDRFRNPLLSTTVLPKQDGPLPIPRHDPNQPGALVMKRPGSVPKGKKLVDVVLDPLLCRHLRPHQREGVQFLYECVMGQRPFVGQGAVLADEMGLGKTLQTIALLWTLLKQNPVYDEPPLIKKALIVCPATLVTNWRKEFMKWLGNERIGVFVADGTKKLRDFTLGKSYSVMIIGYEKLRNVQGELQEGVGVDIVVADEGHRLKTAQNKSAQAIKALNTSKRIILSGTPIQNDLSEFFTMVDFVNPGILNTYSKFKKEFEQPIVKGRQPVALKEDVEAGEEKSGELSALTSPFILRRTAEIISRYLPAKTEYVLMCKPTAIQADAYRAIVSSASFSSALGSPEASLQLITILKKVCNSPGSIAQGLTADEPDEGGMGNYSSSIPSAIAHCAPSLSSTKLQTLGRLLCQLRSLTQEKIVLVSNYTSTLDLLQQYLTAQGLTYLRLDGSTPSSKRQDLVDSFNRTPANICFAFLLSAKAGGTGLNLIGASRLALFDVDWNPSVDLQAMARIHRDGQKREVKIYRLLMAGGLDEKIWQRQITKMGLADSVMDQKTSASSFSADELKDLFTLDSTSTSQTHDLIGCKCGIRATDKTSVSVSLGRNTSVIESEGSSEEDEDLPEVHTLIKASQVDMERQERRIRKRAEAAKIKAKSPDMQSLMQYAHIDTSHLGRGSGSDAEDAYDPDLESSIDDDVLLSVLRERGNRVKFVFAKKAQHTSA